MRRAIEATDRLTLIEGEVDDLLVERAGWSG